jgi:hypothetical protein
LIIGLVSGVLQFLMLAKFSAAVTGGGMSKTTVLFGICQFFLPVAILLGCALVLRDSLLWAAAGMVVALISLAIIRFVKKK